MGHSKPIMGGTGRDTKVGYQAQSGETSVLLFYLIYIRPGKGKYFYLALFYIVGPGPPLENSRARVEQLVGSIYSQIQFTASPLMCPSNNRARDRAIDRDWW